MKITRIILLREKILQVVQRNLANGIWNLETAKLMFNIVETNPKKYVILN